LPELYKLEEAKMKKGKVIEILLAVFISLPIWYFLMFNILKRVNASELMWFLFWVYVPLSIFLIILSKIMGDVE
jgi:hypothetical protein